MTRPPAGRHVAVGGNRPQALVLSRACAWARPKGYGPGPDADPVEPASSPETPVGSVVTHLKGRGVGQDHEAGVAAGDASPGERQVAPGRPVPIGRDQDLVPGATVAKDQLAARHPHQIRVRTGDVADIETSPDQRPCRRPAGTLVAGTGDHQGGALVISRSSNEGCLLYTSPSPRD